MLIFSSASVFEPLPIDIDPDEVKPDDEAMTSRMEMMTTRMKMMTEKGEKPWPTQTTRFCDGVAT